MLLLSLFLFAWNGLAQPTIDLRQNLTYWHNWVDESGVSHLTKCELSRGWVAKGFGPGQPAAYFNTLTGLNNLVYTIVPVGWNPVEFHPNPQFVFWLAGEMRFEAEDGTVKFFRAGDIYFGDDLQSKRGHHSGSVEAIGAFMQFDPRTLKHGTGPCWVEANSLPFNRIQKSDLVI